MYSYHQLRKIVINIFLLCTSLVAVFYFFLNKGVTTNLHYDVCDNFFVQLKGAKRFVIASASYHEGALLYPYMHPNSRQSQLNISSPMETQEIARHFSGNSYILEATLGPGDML